MAETRERVKRLPGGGIGRTINFAPTIAQRKCFDTVLRRSGKTQSELAREALEVYLLSKGYTRKQQGLDGSDSEGSSEDVEPEGQVKH